MKKFLENNKSVVILVLALIVLSLFGYLFAYVANKKVTPKTQKISGEISYIEGGVKTKLANGDWQKAILGSKVSETDQLKTDETGIAIINLDDGSAIRLNTTTEIVLTSLNSQDIVVTNTRGDIYTRVVKADRKFTVVTDTLSAESLGTAYRTINDDKTTLVNVYESKVKVTAKKKSTEILEGKKFTYDKSNKSENTADITKEELSKDKFALWNRDEDIKDDKFKDKLGILKEIITVTEEPKTETTAPIAPKPTSAPITTAKITLSGNATDRGISLSWTVTGVDTTNGFKLLKGNNPDITYATGAFQWINGADRSFAKDLYGGTTYYFRICQYIGGGCGAYSNSVAIKLPPKPSVCGGVPLNSIGLTGSGGNGIIWVPNGCSEFGYKVVWSKTSGPTYPLRNSGDKYHYFSDKNVTTDTLDAFDGTGKYYVRVCEYLGGSCGKYSNEFWLNL